jgi:cell division protein FtsL
MLQHISSASFIEVIILVTAIYYTAVGVVFYRHEIRQFLASKLLKRPAARGKARTPV